MTCLSDSFQRPINYLRISVTDRCDLRCVYCVPPEGMSFLPRSEILTYEEICTVVEAATHLGISKIRLSGGEPLTRAGIVELIKMLAHIKGIDDLSLTTNGMLLEELAADLKLTGLKRVNVSLDTLREDRFQAITGRDGLQKVFRGLKSAQKAGLEPIKVNMVVMRDENDDEIPDFARKSIEEGWHVRFIELMPFAQPSTPIPQFMSVSEIRERLETLGTLEPDDSLRGNGPARYFRFPGANGTIGFISPVSEHFCFGCNRLRLTADGKLRPCLLDEAEIDLRPALRFKDRSWLEMLIRRAIADKPRQHQLSDGRTPGGRAMTQIGG